MTTTSQKNVNLINNAIFYIRNNLYKNITVDNLSEYVCLSKYHFSRLFKDHTGESIYKYLKRIRLERAYYYLVDSNLTVNEVAFYCGFSSATNLIMSFKKYFGVTPLKVKNFSDKFEGTIDLTNFEFFVKNFKGLTYAYIKSFGSGIEHMKLLEDRLFTWTKARGICGENPIYFTFNYDRLNISRIKKEEIDICIEVPFGTKPSCDISVMEFDEKSSVFIMSDDPLISNIGKSALNGKYSIQSSYPLVTIFDKSRSFCKYSIFVK